MPNERARLPAGVQHVFINAAVDCAGGADAVAGFLHCSPRTVRDWRREKFLISYSALIALARAYNIPLPDDIQLEDQFWYVSKGAHEGGLASYQKQGGVLGDPEVRKQKWREWWEREGKFKPWEHAHPLPFVRAEKSIELAEFMGTMMGDGGMTKYQLTVTLHHIDDLGYCEFVVGRIKMLFGITATVRHEEKYSVNIIVASRSLLMQYLHELGLPFGNKVKQRFDIPGWIKENPQYMIACIRGLVDTDGSVFTHRYRVGGKIYKYKKMSFCSSSAPLRNSVMDFLKSHGFHVRVSRGVDVRIESQKDVAHYMQLIGSHNPKHLKRYLK